MRLALVFNPFKYKLHEENLRIVQKYFGLFPPLSLAWVSAIAERAGHQTTIIDARTLGLDVAETVRRLKRFRPDVIGYMMTTYMFMETMEWVRRIRREIPAPVIIGGFNLRIYPAESVAHPEVDFGVVEHALETLPALLAELERGGRDFAAVPGLAWKEDGATRVTPPRAVKFTDFPPPNRRDLPNDLYAEFPTERRNFTVMVTSLGCPCHCVFCEASGYPYNARTPPQVVDEMEDCARNCDVREVDVFDYEFAIDNRRAGAICEEIVRRRLDVAWACRSRVTSVNDELLRLMAAAGCRRIYYGIETHSDEKLGEMHKGISTGQIEAAVRLTRRHGIKTLGFFLVGTPGETAQSVSRTVRYAQRLGLDYAQFSKLTAKPGSGLWKERRQAGEPDYWAEYVSGRAAERELERPWTTLSTDEVNRLARWAYLRFYGRPTYLLRMIWRVRGWREFKRKARALLDMIFSQEKRARLDEDFTAYQENPRRLVEARRAIE